MISTEENNLTPRFLAFSQRISNEFNIVSIDHCYAKPWSSHPDASNARPLLLLFMEKFPRSGNQEQLRPLDIIDVEGEDDNSPPMYDVGKARAMMSDCERHATLLRPDCTENKDDWEEHIAALRTNWSVLQNRIFGKVMRVLQADRLARLSIQGTKNEPIQRRLQIDKAAKRVRFSFGSVAWDMTLILWLHNLFLDNLRGQLLTSYLEVLQTLKAKIPSLIDCLVQGTTLKQGGFALESLSGLLKRNWDPVMSSINQQKLKKLPDSPLLLMISSVSSVALNPVAMKRHKFWQNQLSAMGKVINVTPINNSTSITIANCVENMIVTTRSKILEMKGHFPGRPIILIGWHVGALVATHVALMEVVHGVVCLGFPTLGVYGNRGEVDDQIYSCKTPTLFVIGQHANSCCLDTLEDIREKLRVETGLILVGGADDQLRMSRAKKRSCGVTQAMVDRCIMDEMFEFLGNILSQIVVQPETFEDVEIAKKQRKRKQKDIASTASSQTGNVSKPPTLKTMKAMKAMKAIKFANPGAVGFTGQLSAQGVTKLAKKASPKKRTAKTGDSVSTSKKSTLHLSFPVITTSGDKPTTLSSVNEAAAIASAPELSNLLQNIKTSDQQRISANMGSKTTITSSSTTVATTTALTLSRFLASSGFFRTNAPMKDNDQSAEDTSMAILKSGSDSLLEQGSVEQSQTTDDSPSKHQHQILIRTGTSSAPFSIPLTFTMPSKALKPGGPLMRITGNSTTMSHIQQLRNSLSGTTLPISAATSGATNQLSTTVGSSTPCSAAPTVSSSVSQVTFGIASPSSGTSVSSSLLNSPTIGSGSLSPGASVINIGSDALFMKETPPSTTSVPGTVSIDLGQIATGTSSSAMKLSSAPKISLIPSVKQISIPGSSERLLLTTPVTGSQTAVATLSSLTQSPKSQFKKSTLPSSVATYLKSPQFSSAEVIKTGGNSTSQSPSKTTVTSMTSSQLLSTLSSNSGLITLKLSSPTGSSLTSSLEGITGKDGDGRTKCVGSNTISRTNVTLQGISSTFLAGNRSPSTGTTMPSITRLTDQPQHNLQSTAPLLAKSFGTSATSLIVSTGNKVGAGQLVLQCKGSGGSPGQVAAENCGSPNLVLVSTSETLGQVTSLLESSPVTMGSQRKPLSGSEESGSSSKQSAKVPFSSSPSVSSQGHAKSSKNTISSYTTTSKPVLPTIASTRTRRIKTPKQYDL